MKHTEDTKQDTKETHVRYARKIRIELREELDKWLEKRQAMLVLGIEEESVPSTSEQSRKDGERITRLQEENKRLDQSLSARESEAIEMKSELAKLRVTRKEDDPSLLKQAVEVATKNCREELEKVKTDRDKWKASAEQLRAKIAPGIKTGLACGWFGAVDG